MCERKYLKVLCKPRVMCRLQISVFSLFQSMCATVQKELVLINSLLDSYCSSFYSLGYVVGQRLQNLFQVSSGKNKNKKTTKQGEGGEKKKQIMIEFMLGMRCWSLALLLIVLISRNPTAGRQQLFPPKLQKVCFQNDVLFPFTAE